MKMRWAPAAILWLGVLLSRSVEDQKAMPLVRPLGEVVPLEILGFAGKDLAVSEAEAAVAGFSNHLFRVFEGEPPDATLEGPSSPRWFSIYVGFYESQTQGNTIHSPKNCLPGAGWEALSSEPYALELGDDRRVTVNRYVLQNRLDRAVVFYWYQGRGRIAHDEYRVKWDLLRDAAFRHRSDEALVRILVPVEGNDEEDATRLAAAVAGVVAVGVELALPGL